MSRASITSNISSTCCGFPFSIAAIASSRCLSASISDGSSCAAAGPSRKRASRKVRIVFIGRVRVPNLKWGALRARVSLELPYPIPGPRWKPRRHRSSNLTRAPSSRVKRCDTMRSWEIDAQRKTAERTRTVNRSRRIRDIYDRNVIQGEGLRDISIGMPGMAKMERSRGGSPRGEEVEHDAR